MAFLGLFLFFAISLLVIYFYAKWPYNYWRKQGIEEITDKIIPVFGHTLSILYFRESLSDICTRLYKKSTSSMVGMYHLNIPVLIVREPELIKEIQVKQFNNFRNNLVGVDADRDPFSAAHPFFAKDDLWKKHHDRFAKGMSSKKLKIMFEAMQRVSLNFEKTLELTESEVNLKKLCLAFTSEIVCNAGFGIEYDQTYAKMSGKIFEYTWINEFRHLFNFFIPKLAKILQLNFETEEMRGYFSAIAKRIVENERGDDFVRMTMETLGEVNNLEVATSLVSAFYIDASATAANIISMTLFRLSKHSDIQEKVRDEIRETLDKHNGELSYELLKELIYMQQVINETMRLHPILDVHGKVCTETATLCGSDGQTCTLQPGNIVMLPVLGLHTDERYWNDPENFDPDRFFDERQDKLIRYAYLPFGEGPRQCLGMRFGLIETKIVLVTILKKYKLVSSKKTNFPLKMDTRSTLRSVVEPLYANLVRI